MSGEERERNNETEKNRNIIKIKKKIGKVLIMSPLYHNT